MMVSKPCERRACTEAVTAKGPKTLARRRFCSNRCAYLFRVANGTWHNPTLTRAQRQRGGRLGGVASGETRHKLAMLRDAERIEEYLTPDILVSLDRKQVARVRVLLVHAWRAGYRLGYHLAMTRRKDAA